MNNYAVIINSTFEYAVEKNYTEKTDNANKKTVYMNYADCFWTFKFITIKKCDLNDQYDVIFY